MHPVEINVDYVLEAKYVYADDDGDVLTIGFADDQFEPRQYILLQKALDPDSQDARLAMNALHIEVEDQARSGYGGIASVRYAKEELVIALTDVARKFLHVDGNIRIVLRDNAGANESVLAELTRALNGSVVYQMQ
jgi:hypothetical protein